MQHPSHSHGHSHSHHPHYGSSNPNNGSNPPPPPGHGHYPPYSSQPPPTSNGGASGGGSGGIFRRPHTPSEGHYSAPGGQGQMPTWGNGPPPPGYYAHAPPHSSQTQQQQQPPPPNGHYYSSQHPPPHGHSHSGPPHNQWGHSHQHGHHPNYPPHSSGPPPPNSHSHPPPNQPGPPPPNQPGPPPPWQDPHSHMSTQQQLPPPNDNHSRPPPHDSTYHSHPSHSSTQHPPSNINSQPPPSHPGSHPPSYSRHPHANGPPPTPTHSNDSRSQYHNHTAGPGAPPPPHHSTATGSASTAPPPDHKRKAPHLSAPPPPNHPASMPPPSHHQYMNHHNLPPTPGAPPPTSHGHPPYPLTSPGYHPELRSAHSSASRTGISTPMHSAGLTSPGAFDDDKGRGSYKCGRCGVPKKGHVCPYQPKVKRRPEEPAPEMKCVSTQVEMDEFMTLRRLNLEIQGYPESYAAEPMDMVGAEVHPQPHPHPPQVLVSNPAPYPAASANRRPIPEQSHPSALPSFASMNSHPHPGSTSYPPPVSAPQYSNRAPQSTSTSEAKENNDYEPVVLKSEQDTETEAKSAVKEEPSKPLEATGNVDSVVQSAPGKESSEVESNSENKPIKNEESDNAAGGVGAGDKSKPEEAGSTNKNEDSNKRLKVE